MRSPPERKGGLPTPIARPPEADVETPTTEFESGQCNHIGTALDEQAAPLFDLVVPGVAAVQ
jgi:hypothetical protein